MVTGAQNSPCEVQILAYLENSIGMADNKSREVGELTIAIKALKAVQREARAAAKALRELEAKIADR